MPILFPTSPTVGQVFTSGGRSWVWSGATWDSPTATNTLLAPYGMELISSATFTAQTQIIFDNVFSNKYDNYRIVGSITTGANNSIRWHLRSAGSNLTTNTYYGVVGNFYSNASSTQIALTSYGDFGFIRSGAKRNIFTATISNPFNAVDTQAISECYDSVANGMAYAGFQNTNLASYDGIRIHAAASDFTGSIQIYGMRKQA